MAFDIKIKDTFLGDVVVSAPKIFSDSRLITILYKMNDGTILKSYDDDPCFELVSDGWYCVCCAALPTKEFVEEYPDLELEYYIDGEKIYWFETEITLTDLFESNYEYKKTSQFFLLNNLIRCYLDWCKRILNAECSQTSTCPTCDSEETYSRDLLYVIINAIQYRIQMGDFSSADEILSNISTCSGLCEKNCNCL